MIENHYNLDFTDIRLIHLALTDSREILYGFNPMQIDNLIHLFARIAKTYTADKQVKLMVFKEELLR